MRLLTVLFTACFFLPLVASADSQGPLGYYRFPTLHEDTVVFTAEGDLWRVPVSGGIAQRLTTHAGLEQVPAISRDGRTIAFSAQYEGQTEVCVMPLSGGPVTRLTYEGESSGALVRGWTADGRILYSTLHYATLPFRQLVLLDPVSKNRTFVPLAQADEGTYDESGKTLIFTRLAPQSSHAKRYRGGTAQNLWKWREGASEATPLTADYAGTSRWPLWWKNRIYFASDREGTMNLWSMTLDGNDLKPLTKHTDFGVKNPSLSQGKIVYQNGPDLWFLNVTTGENRPLSITLASDLEQEREQWVTKPMSYLTDLALSPTGDRVALTVRGQVFVAPVNPGRLVEVSRQSGVRYRQATFLGDGKSLAVLSDESGEVEFWRTPANGVGERVPITREGTVLRMRGLPSPDGRWIASAERNQELWLFPTGGGEKQKIATSTRNDFDSPDFAWSPDSQWLAYVTSAANDFGVIWLHHLATGTTTAVTSDRTHSSQPAWSPDGKWLYFLSERTLRSAIRAPWGLRQPEPFLDRSTKVYQLALAAATERSPFQPDDELSTPPKEPSSPKKLEGSQPPPVTVDLDGLSSRLWEVPVPAGNYSQLSVNDKALFVFDRARGVTESNARLLAIEIKNREVELVTVSENLSSYTLSADGKKILFRRSDDLFVIDAAAKAAPSGPALDKNKVNLSALKFSFQPRESWRQMFTDAWRLHRDYFYDPGMHGVDWEAQYQRHLPLIDRVRDRSELNDVLSYMMSELSALHTAVVPGDVRTAPEGETASPASLGARLLRDEPSGGWRIDRIYEGDPDYPDKRSPLAQPGARLTPGDIITQINGRGTLDVTDIGALLRHQAGRQVLLEVSSSRRASPFQVVVTPVSSADAADLRYSDWEYSRRKQVEQATKNQIGYVHLRAMGPTDYSQWARDFYPVIDRPGLILDLRNNRGGNIDSWILSRLLRRTWMWWAPRFGTTFSNMQSTFRGHLVVLVNESTASDGETMANGVRHLGLGTVIGTRTWGGGIWLRSVNTLVDRGIISAAENGSFMAEEGWVIEGDGLTPDHIVDNNPASTYRGDDKQLSAAIAKLQELIAQDPRPIPTAPLYPIKAVKP